LRVWFLFAKTIMYLGNVSELCVMIGQAWEIAPSAPTAVSPDDSRAAAMSRMNAGFVGERGRRTAHPRRIASATGWDEVGCQARGGPTRCKRGGSRPISRVLSRTTIHLGRTSPCASSDLPGSPCGQQERTRRPARFPIWSCSRWGLPCRRMLPPARCALTAPFHPYLPRPACTCHDIGGLLSVALSVGSRPPGVTWHLALWSPDFPPRR
jgi:hypothetical protein